MKKYYFKEAVIEELEGMFNKYSYEKVDREDDIVVAVMTFWSNNDGSNDAVRIQKDRDKKWFVEKLNSYLLIRSLERDITE